MSCPPYAARNKDWSPGGTLTLLEQYNGLGYFRMNRPSPYIWSGTDQYVSGKYVADGKYDPNAIDKQPGCAALLKAMMAIDPSITLGAAKPVSAPTVPAPDRPVPVPAPQGNWLSALLSILASIFRRK